MSERDRCEICHGEPHEVCPWKEEAEIWFWEIDKGEEYVPPKQLAIVEHAHRLRLDAENKHLNRSCLNIKAELSKRMLELGEREQRIKQLEVAIWIDQTGLFGAMTEIIKTVDGYFWVVEGRGPYQWNDDRYREEMGTMIRTLKELCAKSLAVSREVIHSPSEAVSALTRYGERVKEGAAKIAEEYPRSVGHAGTAIRNMPLPDLKENV